MQALSGVGLVCGGVMLALGLAACGRADVQAEKPVAAVQAQTVELVAYAPELTLTGEVRARIETPLSFRVGGQIIERSVDVGDHVAAGQVLARIDAEQQRADVNAAEAAVGAAQAQLQQAQGTFDRQQSLLTQGITTRSAFDQANAALQAAQGSLKVAQAQLDNVREVLGFAELKATAPGIVTERNGEVGEVAQAAQPIYTIAEDGPRDAVFDVQEAIFLQQPNENVAVALALVSDPTITAQGAVREVSPTIDPRTGTVQVKVGITDVPPGMTLRAPVSGSIHALAVQRVVLPWSALWSEAGAPAVWVVDAASSAVALAPVTIASYDTGTVVIESGLKPGDVVVTEGAKLLRPQQVVSVIAGVAP